MKKITYCFHGTTLENAKKLARNGWNWTTTDRPDANWGCSFPDQVYAWCGIWATSVDYCRINSWDEYTEDDEEMGNQAAILWAFGNAQVAAAIQDFRGDTLVALGYKEDYEYEDPDEDFEEINLTGPWSCDYSCENMEGAMQSSAEDLNGRIPDKIIICKGYNPMVRGAVLPVKSEYFPEDRISKLEMKIACSLHNNEKCFELAQELISPWNWEEVNIEELLKIEK